MQKKVIRKATLCCLIQIYWLAQHLRVDSVCAGLTVWRQQETPAWAECEGMAQEDKQRVTCWWRKGQTRTEIESIWWVTRQITVLNRKPTDPVEGNISRMWRKQEQKLCCKGEGVGWTAGLVGAVQGMDRSQAIGTGGRKGHKEIGCAIPSIFLGTAMGFQTTKFLWCNLGPFGFDAQISSDCLFNI